MGASEGLETAATQSRDASRAALRATAAFGFDRGALAASVANGGDCLIVCLRANPGNGGAPLGQSRRVTPFYGSSRHAVEQAVDEMAFQAALALRSGGHAGPPCGWSIHPVAASIVAATGRPLPNPADPRTWIATGGGEIRLANGGGIVNAVLAGFSGVLFLKGASVVDATGDVVGTLHDDRGTLRLKLYGVFPHTLADALVGRPAEAVCNLFAADPRGGRATISHAEIREGDQPTLEIAFQDRLVPLLPSTVGRERWRPRRACAVTAPEDRFLAVSKSLRRQKNVRLSHHTAHAIRRYYAQNLAAGRHVGACLTSVAQTCGPAAP